MADGFNEVKMNGLGRLVSVAFAATVTFSSVAAAKHHHYRHHWHQIIRPVPQESLTTVGTPDCHVQGRLLRIAHHCPPEAVAAGPR
jgi:hypothetical protein